MRRHHGSARQGRIARVVVVLAGLSLAFPADANGPVLHEFIPPDDGEDVALSVTTPDGDLPAAIETSSGVVRAPDTQRPPNAGDKVYREPLSAADSSTFRPDRDTRRPSMVKYDDPFSPSIAPYKRLRAFDMVAPDYALRVRDTSLSRIPVGGEARVGEDEFYADLAVDFEAAATVLIPSVGPDARIVRMHTTPRVPLEVWRDGADNWYVKAAPSQRGRVHVVMQVAISRAAFGGDFVMPSWAGLSRVAPLPPLAARSFGKVAASLGLSRALSPTETVHRLVSYFRGFVPSDNPPRGQHDIYLDLALSQKGVCRHRAFAFLVTALGLGIPARMIVNEAHAWVEVKADSGWRRIDLGGAAGTIEGANSGARASHKPPADEFEWPASSENSSGQQVAERGRSSTASSAGQLGPSNGAGQNAADPRRAAARDQATGTRSGAAEPRSPRESGSESEASSRATVANASDERPRPRVALVGTADVTVHHGSPVRVAGRVEVEGSGCGDLRVDVLLQRRESAMKTNVGALTTGANGAFDGSIFLPLTFPVGDYEVIVSTPGDARCGPGTSAP